MTYDPASADSSLNNAPFNQITPSGVTALALLKPCNAHFTQDGYPLRPAAGLTPAADAQTFSCNNISSDASYSLCNLLPRKFKSGHGIPPDRFCTRERISLLAMRVTRIVNSCCLQDCDRYWINNRDI